MNTQKIFFTPLASLVAVIFVATTFCVALLLCSAIASVNVSAADPVCVPPKDQDAADKAVDPECAKPKPITLNNEQATKAGLTPKSADSIVVQSLNGIYAIVAIVATVTIVLAGIRFITADGDSSKIAAARQTIIYAVVGLAIVGSAFIITGIVQSVGTK
jgi:type IV secretion system pilin